MSWLSKAMDRVAPDLAQIIRDPIGEIKRGPRGSLGEMLEYNSGDDLEEQDQINPNMSAGEVDPDANLGPLQNLAKASKGRKFHNINKQGASILTS